jgi:vanillate O-demethylase ferredoxin subunit
MKVASKWEACRVVAMHDLTPTVREFLLRPDSGVSPRWLEGAHLQIQLQVGDAAQNQTRHYSLVGQSDGEHFRIAVKRMDGGRGGSKAMWALHVGDSLTISGPLNHFALERNAPAYLLIAGGIGITPLLGMAQNLAKKGAPLKMLYGARSEDELAYAEPLRTVLGEKLHTYVGSSPDFAAEIAALPPKAQLYTCGPVPMLETIRAAWLADGRRLAELRFETFGSAGSADAQPFRVRIDRHGLDITVPATMTLLDALNASGIDTIADCKRGECGLCVMDVLAIDGKIDHRDVFLSPHEKQQCNRICPCVSRAIGTITMDSAWRSNA